MAAGMEKKKHITGDTCLSGCESELWKENHLEILRLWALSNPTVDSPSDRIPLLMIFSQVLSSDIICSNFLELSISHLSIYLSTPSIDSIYLFIYYLSRFVPPISKQIPLRFGDNSTGSFGISGEQRHYRTLSPSNLLRQEER